MVTSRISFIVTFNTSLGFMVTFNRRLRDTRCRRSVDGILQSVYEVIGVLRVLEYSTYR